MSEKQSEPVSATVIVTRKDSDESETEKYRSAVDRFDDFINKQENLFGLDDDDPLKDFPNDFTPDDSSKFFVTADSQSPTKSETVSSQDSVEKESKATEEVGRSYIFS